MFEVYLKEFKVCQLANLDFVLVLHWRLFSHT